MLPHPVAVAADVDDVAVVQQPVDQRRRSAGRPTIYSSIQCHLAPFASTATNRNSPRPAGLGTVDGLRASTTLALPSSVLSLPAAPFRAAA